MRASERFLEVLMPDGRGSLFVLEAYFDETERSGRFCVAGCVYTAKHAKRLGPEWRAATGGRVFHAKVAWHRRKEFSDLSPDDVATMWGRLARILNKHKSYVVGVQCDLAELKLLVPRNVVPPKFAYAMCAIACLTRSAKFFTWKTNERVSYIFDQGHPGEDAANAIISQLISTDSKFRGRNHAYYRSEDSEPLQSADFLAWEIGKGLDEAGGRIVDGSDYLAKALAGKASHASSGVLTGEVLVQAVGAYKRAWEELLGARSLRGRRPVLLQLLDCGMPREFRCYEPDQTLLLPPSLRDWLPEDPLAFFISDTIDVLDLSPFEARYGDEGPGNQAFDPHMMIKVLVYAYASGTFSSRKIAAKLREDVAYRVLAADNFPAHRTISDFRQRHLPEFRELFVQVVQIAQEAGLVKLGTLAVDGSKLKANASKHKAMSYRRMQEEEKRLRKEIRDLTQRAQKADAQEDKRYGKNRRGDELPAELARREDRLRTIRAARQRIEARQRAADREQGREPGDQDRTGKPGRPFKRAFGAPEATAQENFTDPDRRIMKRGSSGFEQCYNTQIAVDEAEQIIVAAGVTQSASDVQELTPLLDPVERTVGRLPRKMLADAGYRSESNFQALEARGIEGFVAFGRARGGGTPAKPGDEATHRMARRMKTVRAQEQYRKRKYLGEPPFAWIKSVMGFDRFSLRGVVKVTSEWDLACLAANLRRMHRKRVWT